MTSKISQPPKPFANYVQMTRKTETRKNSLKLQQPFQANSKAYSKEDAIVDFPTERKVQPSDRLNRKQQIQLKASKHL